MTKTQEFFSMYSLYCTVTMSNNTEFKVSENSNTWINWIEEAISKQHIKYYDYEYFYNFEEIGFGCFGKVYRANWKNSHKHLALKSFFNFNNTTAKEIVHEVNYHGIIYSFIIIYYRTFLI